MNVGLGGLVQIPILPIFAIIVFLMSFSLFSIHYAHAQFASVLDSTLCKQIGGFWYDTQDVPSNLCTLGSDNLANCNYPTDPGCSQFNSVTIDSVIIPAGTTLQVGPLATLTINGILVIQSGSDSILPGTLESLGSTINNGIINNYGVLQVEAGSFDNFGTINVYGILANYDIVDNNLTIDNECGGIISGNPISGNPIVNDCDSEII